MKKVLATLVILLTAFTMVSCRKSKDQVTNAVNAPIYTVTFESNGGTTVSAITVESGNTVTAPTAPTKTGYILEGWYKETGLTNKWDFGTDKVTDNITLYAKWEVSGPPVGSVYLRLSFSGSGTLEVGQSMKINYSAIVTGNYQADAVVWSSSNTSVATVDQNGNVTAVGVGTAIIYARTVASGAESQVGVTVYNSSTDPLLKYLMTQNTGVLFTRVITYYGYQGNYDNRISNTANKYLPETLSIGKSL